MILAFTFNFEIAFYILVGIALVFAFVMFVVSCNTKIEPFIHKYKGYKTFDIAAAIDFDNSEVSMYYPFNSFMKEKKIPYNEFLLSLSENYAERFEQWVHKSNNSRIEIIMYDDDDKKRIYRCQLVKFDEENNIAYVYLEDITTSDKIKTRLGIDEKIDFDYKDFTQQLANITSLNNKYVLAIKYKDDFLITDYQNYTRTLLDKEILDIISDYFKGKASVCINNEYFLVYLHAPTININKTLKRFYNKLLLPVKISRRQYVLDFYIGYVHLRMKNGNEAINDAILTANYIMENSLDNHIRAFDKEIASIKFKRHHKLRAIERMIEKDDVEYTFTPIVDTRLKKVSGYRVNYNLLPSYNLEKEEFVNGLFENGMYEKHIMNLFKSAEQFRDNSKDLFICVHLTELRRFMKAYNEYKNTENHLDFIICLKLGASTYSSANEMTGLEKLIKSYKKSDGIVFGLDYQSFQSNYFDNKFYALFDYMVLSKDLVRKSLSRQTNLTMFELIVNSAMANEMSIVALNCDDFALYEFLYKKDIRFISGKIFDRTIKNDSVCDMALLDKLSRIEKTEKQ